jgi:hypothetical protein
MPPSLGTTGASLRPTLTRTRAAGSVALPGRDATPRMPSALSAGARGKGNRPEQSSTGLASGQPGRSTRGSVIGGETTAPLRTLDRTERGAPGQRLCYTGVGLVHAP